MLSIINSGDVCFPSAESKVAINRLHHNFAMVKYPRSALGLPHERVFKIDNDNLVSVCTSLTLVVYIVPSHSKYCGGEMQSPDSDKRALVSISSFTVSPLHSLTVKLHKVVEVREGQWTDSFNKFPYDEVKDQSLSLIFEEESEYCSMSETMVASCCFLQLRSL